MSKIAFRNWSLISLYLVLTAIDNFATASGIVEDFSVRLVNPNASLNEKATEGRLEIYYANVWGTVCDDYFTNNSAKVACASLGFGYIGEFIGNRYPGARGKIWLDDVMCTGLEHSIHRCKRQMLGKHNCGHHEDVSVRCGATGNDAVRLINSLSTVSNPMEGRLEIQHSGIWGTVCGSRFTNVSAAVVCASLGFGYVGAVIGNRHGYGTGQIWLDDVTCSGTEPSVDKCEHGPWGVHNCDHNDDVSISCGTTPRLINSLSTDSNTDEGRLEIYFAGAWSTVCDEGFGSVDAGVACAGLGYGHVGTFIGNRHGAGTGPVVMKDVGCNGTETSLGRCPHNSHPICSHEQDVSIRCGHTRDFAVRLLNPQSYDYAPMEGRLEIYYAGVWGAVCAAGFTNSSARVACASLGFGYIGAAIGSRHRNGTGQIWLDEVNCNGSEATIDKCKHSSWGSHDCTKETTISISCGAKPRIVNELSLTNNPKEGRLEIYYAGEWGSVCGNGFSHMSARVACASLGYGLIGAFIGNRHSGGTGQIWLDNVFCNGTEKGIDKCVHSLWGYHNCSHAKTVSISCGATPRLVNSLSSAYQPKEGRLEVYYAGRWGPVCDTEFTDYNARVACYSLGFGTVGASFVGNRHGNGFGEFWLDGVNCTGIETSIDKCAHSQWGAHGCTSDNAVSIRCGETQDFDLRLVNNYFFGDPKPKEGRLEIYYSGTWGSICDDGFTNVSASVACAKLGYGNNGTFVGNRYTGGYGQIWLDDVSCTGKELNINECSHRPWGWHNCEHGEDVSISCVNNTVTAEDFTLQLRLVNTLSSNGNATEGRVEIRYAGVWGSVCSNGFTNISAGVACASLGLGNIGTFIGNRHGSGSGRIWLDGVVCIGTEEGIDKCAHRSWGMNRCVHTQDVSVRCGYEPGDFDARFRLVNTLDPSKNTMEGRLEIYYARVWGTVCSDGFTDTSAGVTCASLGFGNKGVLVGNRHGSGTGQIWLDDVSCNGTEQSLDECSHRPWGSHDCNHDKDISLSCGDFKLEFRLVNNLSSSKGYVTAEGRLEVLYAGVWGTVCDDFFTSDSARVACASLGFGYVGSLIANRHGNGTGQIWLDDVKCVGTEQSIDECEHSSWGLHNCDHREDVWISCGKARGNATDITVEDGEVTDASGEVFPDTTDNESDALLLSISTTLPRQTRESSEMSTASSPATSRISATTVEALTLHRYATSLGKSTPSSSTINLVSFDRQTVTHSSSVSELPTHSLQVGLSSSAWDLSSKASMIPNSESSLHLETTSTSSSTVSHSTSALGSSDGPTMPPSSPVSALPTRNLQEASSASDLSSDASKVSNSVYSLHYDTMSTMASSTSILMSPDGPTVSLSSSESSLPTRTFQASSSASDLLSDVSEVLNSVSSLSSSTSTKPHTTSAAITTASAQLFDTSKEEIGRIQSVTSTDVSTSSRSSTEPSTETSMPLINDHTSEMLRNAATASNTDASHGQGIITVVMFPLLGISVIVLIVVPLTLYVLLQCRRSAASLSFAEHCDPIKTDDIEMDIVHSNIVPLENGHADSPPSSDNIPELPDINSCKSDIPEEHFKVYTFT